MSAVFSKDVESAIRLAAERHGLEPDWLRAIARVESSGNPKATKGSYSGLFQISPEEFKRVGGKGDILDPNSNAMAAASLLKGHTEAFEKQFGRMPELAELYMIHQQGWGGFQAHQANPEGLAWENMGSTKEGRARGEAWAKKAILGNLTPADKKQFGEDITSGQFIDRWKERIGGMLEDSLLGRKPARLAPGQLVPASLLKEAAQQEEPSAARGDQGSLGSYWPSVGERVSGVVSEGLQNAGLPRAISDRLSAPVGTIGDVMGGGTAQALSRAGARLASEPSRKTVKDLGLEVAMALPVGKAARAGKLGITEGGKKVRDLIQSKGSRSKPPTLPEGMKFVWKQPAPGDKKNPASHIFRIEQERKEGGENKIIGEASVYRYPGEPPTIGLVIISGEHQQKGLGTKLYDFIDQSIKQKLVPSRTLLPPGFGLWQGRNPRSVAGYEPNVEGDRVTSWGPRPRAYGYGPDSKIDQFHGQPTDPSTLRYPEYGEGDDPFKSIRVNRPIITYHGGRDIKKEMIEEDIYPLGLFRWEMIGTGGGLDKRGRGFHSSELEETAKGYKEVSKATALVGGGARNLDDPLHAAALTLKNYKGVASTSIKRLEEQALAMANMPEGKFQAEVLKQAAWAIRNGKELPKVTRGEGKMYELAIHANPEHFIDLDKPISQQSDFVKAVFNRLGVDPAGKPLIGAEAIHALAYNMTQRTGKEVKSTGEEVSTLLKKQGVPGMRYYDLGSQKRSEGSRNYIALNEYNIEILRKYGLLPPVAVGAASAAMSIPDTQSENPDL